MKFELPTELSSIIKVIGVGGGGSNAVNHMHAQGIRGVDFIICNTDKQALDMSPVPVKLQLGAALTEGLGAGSIPDRGKDAAQENIDEIRQLLSTRTKMVFITAGMGGGTGTGAAPVIARIARDMGILTVGIVTNPFLWEGRKRKLQASSGIEEMRQAVDTLLVINNDRLRDLYGNLTMDDAFAHADNVLTTAARGIAEIITKTGKVNVDFEDVRTVMTSSGVAIMGMAEAEGEDRALRAAQDALSSPLLNDNDIAGAKYVLLNVALGDKTISMDEMTEITDHIQDAAGSSADVIWGYCTDENLGDRIRVTVIATGFNMNPVTGAIEEPKQERKVIPLDTDVPTMITAPIANPVTGASTPAAKVPVPPSAEKTPEPYLKTVAETPAPPPPAPVQEQRRIEFEVEAPFVPRATVAPQPPAPPMEKVTFDLYEGTAANDPVYTPEAPRAEAPSVPPVQHNEPRVSPVEHQARVEDRLARMREMSLKLRTPNGLADMEREPAFKRKNVALSDTPHSTDSNVSRYTLSEETDENGERRVELRRNNPFLHDNVD
ncbi:MAG: cell division protein FtsZ [Flavobacteriales bacterium]